MKVLLTITGLGMGGAERMVADLADGLVSAGCEVRLVYLNGPVQVRPQRREVDVIGLGMKSPGSIIAGYFKLRKMIREFKPDIVHSHMFHATLLTRLLRLTAPIPHISTMHSGYAGGRLRVLAYRFTDWLTDISTNVSHVAMANFVASRAVRADRMVVVYNSISTEEFRPSPEARARTRNDFNVAEDCKLFLAVGRLVPQKDYPNLFQALARLPQDLHVRLLIAGDGPLRPQLEALVDDLGLSSRVQFLGIRQDVAALMAAADVFVLSSIGEPFGLVVAEAMACECIVVATDTGGVREVLGDTGFLVPPSDPVALADALRMACMLPHAEAIRLGRAARQRVVDAYSSDRALEKWRELYSQIIENQSVQQTAS